MFKKKEISFHLLSTPRNKNTLHKKFMITFIFFYFKCVCKMKYNYQINKISVIT